MTVLHVAAQKSNLEIINLLMETRKLSVNEQDNGGWTALMWTAEGMRRDVARCLLKWGANVNILDTVSRILMLSAFCVTLNVVNEEILSLP
jgi:ankyrin repeat protein